MKVVFKLTSQKNLGFGSSSGLNLICYWTRKARSCKLTQTVAHSTTPIVKEIKRKEREKGNKSLVRKVHNLRMFFDMGLIIPFLY